MAPRASQPTMLPYRDNDGALRYAPSPALHDSSILYDDEGLPLISNGAYFNEDQDQHDPTQRFTATGKPMPVYRPSAYANMSFYSAPQHLPQRYTDDSIIPVVIQLPDPLAGQRRRRSIMDKIKGSKSDMVTKVVFMPRRDYLKHFAKDYNGNYIGTEPRKDWTSEELEESFGMYKKDLRPKRDQRGQTMMIGLNGWSRGRTVSSLSC